jgi:hypothetical protein
MLHIKKLRKGFSNDKNFSTTSITALQITVLGLGICTVSLNWIEIKSYFQNL